MLYRNKNTEGQTRRVADLEYDIAESRRLRPLLADPDHTAVVMQRHARRTLAGLWVFLCLGLVFTTTGVQRFLAGDVGPGDPVWWAAWCVEPMFAGLLITLLNFEAVILAHGVAPGHAWWSRLKHTLLASTLAMNVLPQLAPLVGTGAFNLGALAVHAVVPLIVYGVAEVIPVIQARIHQIIRAVSDHTNEPVEEPSLSELASPVEPESSTPAVTASESELESASTTVEPEPESTSAEPAEPPASASTASPSVEQLDSVRSLKLPESVVTKLRQAHDTAASQGRKVTTGDVQQAVKLPASMAERIVAELANHTNGRPVSVS